MKIVAAVLAGILVFSGFAIAETPYTVAWTRQLGTSDWEMSYGVSADVLGNVYITGFTGGNLGGPTAGMHDAFISKYEASGNLAWTRQFGSYAGDYGRGVSADGLGNVYMTGYTYGNLSGVIGNGDGDIIISKYDASGNAAWTHQIGTYNDDFSYGVSVGLNGVYITGSTKGNLGGPNAGGRDAFISKYDTGGNLVWARQLGTISNDESHGVSADGLGNVYISGYTQGGLSGPNAGSNDVFISKYDASGNLAWTRQMGTSGGDASRGVSADVLGNVYISGYTYGSLDGPNAGLEDVFISKYDASGNLAWTRQIGTSGHDESYGVSADGLGNVYITGYTYGSLAGPGAGVDAFLAKYDVSGNLLWMRQLGTNSGDYGRGVSTDGLGNVYINGDTWGSLGGPIAGMNDAFLVKYFPEPVPLEILIDIKPGSDPNSINLGAKGVVPVAIFGAEEFDVNDVDQFSLLLEGAGPKEKGKDDIHVAFEYINDDLFLDIIVQFSIPGLELEDGAMEAALTGSLLDGTEFVGIDAVRLVGGPTFRGDVHGIPEPASASLLLLGAVAMLRRRRRP